MIIYSSPLSPPSPFLRPCGVSSLLRFRALEPNHAKWKKSKKIRNNNNSQVIHHRNPSSIFILTVIVVFGLRKNPSSQRGRRENGVCRAELAQDVPFAAAIGACVLTSLVSPIAAGGPDDEEGGGGAIDSTDARFAVMGIISFIPYFNWMSWVFAWLDSGKQRYLVYSIVYLAPYLRTNLSLSPEESWLPIASIFICIIHVQLEASIRNGDLNGIQLFGGALKLFSSRIKEDAVNASEEFGARGKKQVERGHPRKPVHETHHLNENHDVIADENKSD